MRNKRLALLVILAVLAGVVISFSVAFAAGLP